MSDAHTLKNDQQVKAADKASIKVTIDVGPPRFARVKVLAEDGIFKNGHQYKKGDEAIISLSAAETFADPDNGAVEVEILGEVDVDETPNATFEEHGIITHEIEREKERGGNA